VFVSGIDLRVIKDSGQCFRLNERDGGSFTLAARGRLLIAEPRDGGYEFLCPEEDCALWRDYFDLDGGYDFDAGGDEFLKKAMEYGRGMRILRQEPWETLVTFIISQRKNIPAITACVETLCRRYGAEIDDGFYAFPEPEALLGADLALCSLGYRDKYIRAAAEAVVSGAIDLNALKNADDEELKQSLMSLFGVGPKVAACVMLFGFHRLASFPVDVWIARAIEREYGGELPDFGENAGILQQYIFYYIRSLK
jgi:N-glycosylase/DNA lyase